MSLENALINVLHISIDCSIQYHQGVNKQNTWLCKTLRKTSYRRGQMPHRSLFFSWEADGISRPWLLYTAIYSKFFIVPSKKKNKLYICTEEEKHVRPTNSLNLLCLQILFSWSFEIYTHIFILYMIYILYIE